MSTALFTLSAAMHAVSIPGHLFFGIKHLDPVLENLDDSYAHRLARACASGGWDHMHIGILTGGRFFP